MFVTENFWSRSDSLRNLRNLNFGVKYAKFGVFANPGRSEKKALHLSGHVFSTKVTTEDTIFTSPTGDGTAILRHPLCHAKV